MASAMALGFVNLQQLAQSIKESGAKTDHKETVFYLRYQTSWSKLDLMDIIWLMGKLKYFFRTENFTKEISNTIKETVSVFTIIKTGIYTTVSGLMTKESVEVEFS